MVHNGVQLIELQVQMKLGEYYALQSAHLRQLQKQANQAVAKAREQRLRSMRAFEAQSSATCAMSAPSSRTGY